MKKTSKVLLALGWAGVALGAIGLGKAFTSDSVETKAAVTAGTYTYDLVTKFSTYASAWTSSYTTHTIASTELGTDLPAVSIDFAATNKQGSTITTMPVSKASADSFTLTEAGFVITSVEVVVSQWTTKIPTIYVKEAGASSNNYSGAAGLSASGSTGTEGTTGAITFAGTSVKSFSFGNTSTNQIGWKSLKVTIAAAATFGTLKSISVLSPAAKTAFEVGETFSSAGLSLTATDSANVTKTVSSGFTTDFDTHVFTATEVGTKNVTVSYTEGSVTATVAYSIIISVAPVYTHDFTASEANCFTANYDVAGNIAAGEYGGYKALSGLGWNLDAKYNGSVTGVEFYSNALTLGTNTIVCSSFTMLSDIFGVNDNYAVSKIVISVGGNSSIVGTLSCKVGDADFGTQSQVVPTSQTDLVFSSETPSYGKIQLDFAQTSSKGLRVYNVRVYATAGSGNTHDAYVFAKKAEVANGCLANAALVNEYKGLTSEVKAIVDPIKISDYSTPAIKAATIPYKSVSPTVAEKIAAIERVGSSQPANKTILGNDNADNTALLSVLGGSAIVIAGAFFFYRKKKRI